MKWMKAGTFGVVLGIFVAYAYGQVGVASRPIPTDYKYQALNDATGNYTAIAGVTGQKIQVWAALVTTGANTTVEFKSGARTLTSAMTINGIFQWVPSGKTGGTGVDECAPLFETDVGAGFVIVTGTPTQVSGQLGYTTSQ